MKNSGESFFEAAEGVILSGKRTVFRPALESTVTEEVTLSGKQTERNVF